ncbi:Dps family protein [Prevotella sp. OH937_COT-195]|uniref:Dps family protein n=1 Tax=Prevotella sp. OH937_COT-195 TaxID=2491051 RepID=UPI000F64BEF3|nr:Dps family protein [Prevotella sp. OH937_COT-195]RRD00249.1 DNA starvation/stationary phase protection protein [Prevotella sp. OH937_COT-195]
MRTLDYLSLDEKKVKNVVNGLSQLLADLQVYYTNLRGFHWNVSGHSFYIMHEKYEEFYNDAAEKIDEVAERMLQLGGMPESRFSEYLKIANIKEVANTCCDKEARKMLLGWLKSLIAKERELLAIATEAGDDVTVSLMSDYLRGQEKALWMLVASGCCEHDEDASCGCGNK